MSTETKTSFKATDVSTDEKRVDGRLVAWSEGVGFVPKGARIGWDLLWSDVKALFDRRGHLFIRSVDSRLHELDVNNPEKALIELRAVRQTASRSASKSEHDLRETTPTDIKRWRSDDDETTVPLTLTPNGDEYRVFRVAYQPIVPVVVSPAELLFAGDFVRHLDPTTETPVTSDGVLVVTRDHIGIYPFTKDEAHVRPWIQPWERIEHVGFDVDTNEMTISCKERRRGLSTTAGSNRTVYGIDAEEAKVLQSLYRDARRGKIERAASPMGFQFGLVKEMLPEDEPRLSVVTLEDRTVLAVNGGRLVPTTLDPGETLVWAVNATQMTSPETLINGALVATSERLLLVPSVGEEGRWAVEWSKVKSITPQKLPDDLRRAAKRSGLSLAAGIIGDQLFEFPGTGLAARYVMKKLKRWHVCVELATGERQYLLSSGVGAKDASAALDRIRANSRLRKQRFVHEESIVTLAELVGETAVTDDQAADSTAPMADEAEVSVPPAPGSNAADRTEPKTALVSADTAGASSPRTGSSPENANGDVPLRQIDRLASKTVDRLAPDEQQAIRNLERLAERGLLPTVQYETSVLRTLATAGISDREWFDWSLRAERQNEAGVVDGFLVTRSAGVQFVPVEPTAPTWAAAWDAVADVDLAFLDTVDGTAATDDVLLTVTAAGGRVESFVVGSDAGSSVDATVEALSSFVDRSTPAIGEDDVTPSVADGSASARGRRTSG